MGRGSIVAAALGLAVLGGTAATAAVSVYLSPEELTARAPLIVEAQVIDQRSGVDPRNGALRTYVTLAIDEVHRGPAGLTTVVVREPGGRWGELVHEMDAVPVYVVGERVFAYLEPAADGALRTVGMFFGKFRIEEESERGPLMALRDLDGQGTILGRGSHDERLSRSDLAALAAGVPFRPLRARPARKAGRSNGPVQPSWNSHPPEWERLLWAPARGARIENAGATMGSGVDIAFLPADEDGAQFVPLDAENPARWIQPDSGFSVVLHVEPAGNPLNDDQAAVFEIARAIDAWTDVPQSRMQLVLGNTNYPYTQTHGSPASNYSGINIVLFDDPYDDISDPTGCGGVLAIGGYWRSLSGRTTVNNVAFHQELQMYVIFNNAFECFLGYPDNLAELATHEIGHGIGFGHSSVSDAIMRSGAYGGRGPRLGSDDIDAAHCHYPHTLTLTRPNGGEVWTAGDVERVEWNVTTEAGPDEGTVDLEYSTDGGVQWSSIASGVANDGTYDWTVPDDPGANVVVRIMRPTYGTLNAPYPAGSCSQDASDGTLSLLATAPQAGSVGNGLTVEKNDSMIRLRWSASCSNAAADYAIYRGSLAALRSGGWDHAPLTCNAGTDLVEDFVTAAGNHYYLIAARAGSAEGWLGPNRPPAATACATREVASCTP